MAELNPKVWAPVVVLVLAGVSTAALVGARRAPESNRAAAPLPVVQTLTAQTTSVEAKVTAQGTVEPRSEVDLVSEVAGRLVWVSPRLASGDFFDQGDLIARIDGRDYEAAADAARAAVARSESQLSLATSSLERARSMRQGGASSRAALDEAIHAEAAAEAGLREALAAQTRAQLDLERSEIRAPFAARVRERFVDEGQFLRHGEPVSRVYAVDYAEVRLPIPDGELAFIDLPWGYRGDARATDDANAEHAPAVTLRARFAGREHTWEGRLVRMEGALDEETRMVRTVVRVKDPYARGQDDSRPPLTVGLFVEAEIRGRTLTDVIELPRSALRGAEEVVVVDAEGGLHMRSVEVARSGRDRVWVASGIAPGERIAVSPLGAVVEGMKVDAQNVSLRAAMAESAL